MKRAFLLGFLVAPLPFLGWLSLLWRTSRPDVIGITLGGLAGTIPLLYLFARLSRFPFFVLCWLAIPGVLFWCALRYAVKNASSAGEFLLTLGLFPWTGFQALQLERGVLFVVTLLIWSFFAGFAAVLKRREGAHVTIEKIEPEEEEGDETPPPREEPYFVPRPPPKPKGPAFTPKTRPDTPPPVKRVPGK